MMIEWLITWGGSEAVKFIAQEVIGELAKGTAEDYVKDFFKQGISDAIGGIKNGKLLQKATAQAIKYFLDLIQQELEDAELSEGELKAYTKPLKQFIKNPSVLEVLVSAFDNNLKILDTKILATIGNEINPPLPDEFNWDFVAEQYRRRVKKIIRESDELREILDSENLDKLANKNSEIRPDFDLEKYQEGILEQYGNLKLESLDTSGYAYNQLTLWRMFIPQNVRESQEFLPQIHEIPKEYRQRLKDTGQFGEDFSQEQLDSLRRRYLDRPIRSVLELVEDRNYQYLVILGDPGSGKSTLLQYIALQWAELPLKDLPLQPIPLLIELRTYVRNHDANKCQDFLDFLEKGSGITCQLPQPELHAKLQNGDAIVMFDGLDEVFEPAKREEVITDIHRFTNVYKKVRVIVTSRVIGYKPQKLRDAQFDHFMLQDLQEEQVEDFIQRWHDLTYQDEAERERKRERLKRAIKDSPAIKQLSGNPLLLTMMAILNRHQELPRDRAELYNQASRVLLHQWDMERALINAKIDPITIDYKDKQAILRRVAHFMQGNIAGLAGNLILGDDLERIISEYLKSIEINDVRSVARALMEQLRSRNFILCFVGAEYYAFVHRTFLEYFCAREFVWQFEKEQKIDKDELIEEVFGNHWQDETWHEVLRLIAGMIDVKFVGEVISYLMEQDGEEEEFKNLFFAGKCLFEVRSRLTISDVGNQLLDRLKKLVRYDLGYYYGNYYYLLYTNNFRGVNTSNDYEKVDLVRKIRTQAVKVVAGTWKDELSTYIWLKQLAEFDDDGDIRREAIEQMAIGWKYEPETLPMLKQWAQFDDDLNVRREAVRQIAIGWKNCPETLAMLKQWAQFDAHWNVRREAVRQIATGWKNHPEVLTMLKYIAQFDDDEVVQGEAIEQIATGWKNSPETLPMIKQWVQLDEDGFLRLTAVKQIATGWKNDPETLPMLKHLVQFDDDQFVRREAIEQIATGWKNDPETLSILKQQAQFDNSRWVGEEAVRQIATGWKNHPETLPMLKQLVNSYNEDTRREAVRQIAIHWKDDSEILPILKHLAQSDDESNVRQEAVRQIATRWKDDSETLSILKHLAQSDNDSNVRREAVRQIAIGWKNDPDTLPMLKQWAQFDNNQQVRREAVRQIAIGGKDNPEALPMLKQWAQFDDNWQVRLEAVRQLTVGWKDNPETLPMLKQWAQFDDDAVVRLGAMQQLATGWKNDPDTLHIIKQRLQSDDNLQVQRKAVQLLGKVWKNDPETLPMLKQLAQSDNDSSARAEAVQVLGKVSRNDPEMLPMIKQMVRFDRSPYVREKALEILAEIWKNDPETLPMLKQKVEIDNHWRVRQKAVLRLAIDWKNDSETLPMLKQKANTDNDWRVRHSAVIRLAIHWKRDPETFPMLKQLAKSDNHRRIRQEAVEQLANVGKSYPETLPILKQLAQSDDDSDVRQEALQQIARGWKANPEMLEFFHNCALNDPFERQDDLEDSPFVLVLSTGIKDYDLYAPLDDLIRDRLRDEFPYIQPNPRQTALEAIVKQYRDHPQTLPLLQDRAENDPDEQLREWAKKKLQRSHGLWHGYTDEAD